MTSLIPRELMDSRETAGGEAMAEAGREILVVAAEGLRRSTMAFWMSRTV